MDERIKAASPLSLSDPVRVAVMFGAMFFVMGLVTPYLPVWLNARGLSVGEIGILTVLPQLVRIAAAPIIGFSADQHHTHKTLTISLAALAVVGWLLLASTRGFATAFIALLLVAISNCLGALVETIAMSGVRTNGHDYGRMRLAGTVAFVAANLVGGWCIAASGTDIAIWLILAGAIATVVAAYALPRLTRGDAATRPLTWADARALLAIPHLRTILLASGAVQGAHGMFYTFGTLHWQTQGLDARWFGALWSLGLVAEVAIFWWSKSLIARFGALGVFLVGAVASVLRWTALGFDPPLALLIPLQVLHGITFGASHLGAMHALSHAAPADRAATAQALHSVVSGICIAVATALATHLYPSIGGAAYLGMAVLALAGTVAAMLLLTRSR